MELTEDTDVEELYRRVRALPGCGRAQIVVAELVEPGDVHANITGYLDGDQPIGIGNVRTATGVDVRDSDGWTRITSARDGLDLGITSATGPSCLFAILPGGE